MPEQHVPTRSVNAEPPAEHRDTAHRTPLEVQLARASQARRELRKLSGTPDGHQR